MAEISIHSAAEAEYEEALCRYLKRSARAALGFEAAFEQALDSIAFNPNLYPMYDELHRFCWLRRYPYLVIYRVDEDQVRVIAVMHAHQLPGCWLGRN